MKYFKIKIGDTMDTFTNLKKALFFLIMIFLLIDSIHAQGSYFFYSFSADPWTFNRRNDDGTAQLTVYTPPTYQINESAVDGSNNKVYFYESSSNIIFQSDYDGSNRTSAFTTSGPITSMAAGNGYIFYAYLNSPYSVRRCNSNGTGDIQLYVNPSYGNVFRIAYDAGNNYLYYYEQNYDNTHNRIFRTDANGSNFTVIYNNCAIIKSLAAGAGYVFYSYTYSPWTFNRRNADGSSETLIYTPPAGTVMLSSYDATINKLIFYDDNVGGSKTIYKANADGSSLTSLYNGFIPTVNSLAAPSAPSITFTDGSGFTQSITPGSTNQALGRFLLTGTSSGATLTAASIKLNGTRTGLTNFKLWSSTDASFGSDTQLGSTVAADPGDGGSISFSSLTSSISISGTYYFLTTDVAAGATGTAQGVIVQNSSLTLNGGSLSGTISNAALSSNAVSLPVELNSFTATTVENKVTLNWQTATEVSNYGFEVERTSTLPDMNWEKVGFVKGNGNSNSPKEYSFIDNNPGAGKYLYRLKQMDTDGKYTYSKEVDVTFITPTAYALAQNYPNPFNPNTVISYQLSVVGKTSIKVYDMLGNELATLVNETKEPGIYNVAFDGSQLPSGVYFYKIVSGKYSDIKKMILLR
ncbi:MAG: T9SS type A sorting domain-containing protein [Ignavibacteriaceae bacterium]